MARARPRWPAGQPECAAASVGVAGGGGGGRSWRRPVRAASTCRPGAAALNALAPAAQSAATGSQLAAN